MPGIIKTLENFNSVIDYLSSNGRYLVINKKEEEYHIVLWDKDQHLITRAQGMDFFGVLGELYQKLLNSYSVPMGEEQK